MKTNFNDFKVIIGVINFPSEVVNFTDTEKFLSAIKKECFYNFNGFSVKTLSKVPQLLKAVDDIFYNECGVENPNDLNYYKS